MTNQTRFCEPLTSQSAALVLVDHQFGLMTGVRDYKCPISYGLFCE
jgi:hypothetical protein